MTIAKSAATTRFDGESLIPGYLEEMEKIGSIAFPLLDDMPVGGRMLLLRMRVGRWHERFKRSNGLEEEYGDHPK